MPPVPPLPPDMMRAIYAAANSRTKARMAAADKGLLREFGARGTSYLRGTGKYQALWNVDRQLMRLVYSGRTREPLSQYDSHVEEAAMFVRQAKRRYKELASRGVAAISIVDFMGGIRLDKDWGRGYADPDLTDQVRHGRGFFFRGHDVPLEAKEFVKRRKYRSMGRKITDQMKLEHVMDDVLVYGKERLDGVLVGMTRKQRAAQPGPGAKMSKNMRRIEHAWAPLSRENVHEVNVSPTPPRQLVDAARARARNRRLASRAARRAAAAAAGRLVA